MAILARFFPQDKNRSAPILDDSQKAGTLKLILSFEDPQYPHIDFYAKLLGRIADIYADAQTYPQREKILDVVIKKVVQEHFSSDQNNWNMIVNSSFSKDVFDIVLPYIGKE